MTLPEDIQTTLVHGVGAYIRAMDAVELPGPLRRFRGFRPKTLMRHRDEILGVLDDDAQRKRIVQWLDDESGSLNKESRNILRIAAQREDGWEKTLTGLSRQPEEKPSAGPDLSAELERERAKTKAARSEARAARAELRDAVGAESRRASAAEREAESLRADVARLRRRVEEMSEEKQRASDSAERALRKAERDSQKARQERDATRSELKEARRELTAAGRRVGELEAKLEPKKPSPEPKAEPPPERRRPLEVPKGLFDDDPKALDAWLRAPKVSLLIDGYNVSKAEGGFGDLSLETQRQRLIDEVGRLSLAKKVPATIVFDGARVSPGTSRRVRQRVRVEYSKPPETADDHLVAVLAALPTYPVVVVTNDRELQGRARALGATIARSQQLLALLR